MELREYLDILSEQIRCKKARPMVVEEIKAHIEDQAEAYIKEGMGEEQAMAKSILEMGDPVEAGVALDRVHRPKMQWTLVLSVVLLSLIGMFMQIVIFKTGCLSNDSNITTIRDSFIYNSIWNTLIGFGAMALVCMIDYTFLAKHPVALWWAFLVVQFLIIVNILGLPYFFVRSSQIIYYEYTLMVPVYGAIVFLNRNKGMAGFMKCIGLYLVSLVFKLLGGVGFLSALLELTVSVIAILTVAVLKGWFGKQKAGKLAIIWIPAIGLPFGLVTLALFFNDKFHIFAEYQAARIRALFRQSNDINYQTLMARSEMQKVTLFGTKELPLTTLPAIQNDYIITSMFTYFGALLTILVLGLFGFFLWKAFRLGMSQKNQLGSMISIGCAVVLLVKTVVYLIPNIGGLPVFGQMSMPFLSYGLGNAIVNGIIVGLLLSVYRNTDIISERHIKAKYMFRFPIQKV